MPPGDLRVARRYISNALHWTFVGQVERGRRNITLHNILKLAAALNLDAGEFVAR